MTWQASQPPMIAGAGIAGLSTALALAHKGIPSLVFESCKKLEEVGAGLQLAPNATRLLKRWGVLEELETVGIAPHYLELKDGLSLKTHLSVDLRYVANRRWHAPYITIHRADLQDVLFRAALRHPLITIHLGERVVSNLKTSDNTVDIEILKDENIKNEQSSPLLIACDGAWSKARQAEPLNENAKFSGFIAWRATIAVERLPSSYLATLKDIETVAAWMGPRNHLVAYPVQSGKSINFVAITQGNNPGQVWSRKGNKNELKLLFKDWDKSIHEIFDIVDEWTYWPLFQMPNHRFIAREDTAFVGDAAHAFLPFSAQGAAMAIEDAAALAEVLSMDNLDLAEALSLYSNVRTSRVKAVSKRGDFNRFVYHATGPIAFARNLTMHLRPPESFMAGLDWLYSYDATAFSKNT